MREGQIMRTVRQARSTMRRYGSGSESACARERTHHAWVEPNWWENRTQRQRLIRNTPTRNDLD
jgi:hypothetical protein